MYKGTPSPLVDPPVCARSARVGLTLSGRWLRRSRDVWRFRLRNDATLAARQTHCFDAVETVLQLLFLGTERTPNSVERGLAPAAASCYPLVGEKTNPVEEGLAPPARAQNKFVINHVG